jgi:hypothetical protein
VKYSADLPGDLSAVATFTVSADATSTLFVATTPDDLRSQDTFATFDDDRRMVQAAPNH